jgi:hypothetical protein
MISRGRLEPGLRLVGRRVEPRERLPQAARLPPDSPVSRRLPRWVLPNRDAAHRAQRVRVEAHAEPRAMGGDRRSRLPKHRAVVAELLAKNRI